MTQVKGAFVPNLNVAGFWDQEDPWGPWEIYRRSEASDPNRYNFIVAGPWFHGQWHNLKAESIGQVSFGGHDTALEFREKIEAPWFRYWLHGKGEKFPWKASTFQTGSNSWQTYAAWPPTVDARPSVYLQRRRRAVVRRAAGAATATCSTSPTRRTRCRIARVRSRRPIPQATGGGGKSRISASSTTVPTSRRGSARRSIAT